MTAHAHYRQVSLHTLAATPRPHTQPYARVLTVFAWRAPCCCLGAVTFGALLGKVSPLQILILGFLEIICFSLNEQILLKIGILDVGGSIIVHLFGAYVPMLEL